MKLSLTLFLGFVTFSLVTLAGPPTDSEYYICQFSNSVTQLELNEFVKQGFQIVHKKNDNQVVYVKAKPNANFSVLLKSKMEKIIQVDQHGNHTIILEEEIIDESPEFLRLFFNFM